MDLQDEAPQAVATFKHYMDHRDGWLLINRGDGEGFANETKIQVLLSLPLRASHFDLNREVNSGRGPVDFRFSMGSNKSVIGFKPAERSSLEPNIECQLAVYEEANQTNSSLFLVIGYTPIELAKTVRVMKRLDLNEADARSIVLVYAAQAVSVKAGGTRLYQSHPLCQRLATSAPSSRDIAGAQEARGYRCQRLVRELLRSERGGPRVYRDTRTYPTGKESAWPRTLSHCGACCIPVRSTT